ncbi:MAG: penicillin acylase family protein [Pirellulaceae bacterium]|nr:penicillin acylase family protein [Pirellulaceae bacterium]
MISNQRIGQVMLCVYVSFCHCRDMRAQDTLDAAELARQVTIHRDQWGVPHIDGPTDAAVVFGMGYCQSEDYFWQVEENLLRALGRCAEAVGSKMLPSDMLSRNFNIAKLAQAEYPSLGDTDKRICSAYAAGINYYLQSHPEVKPRLLEKIEPWYILAHRRQTLLDWTFTKAHLPEKEHEEYALSRIQASNGWAIDRSKTKNGSTMLFINPHQPWFGPGSWYEAHLKSGEGLNFSGAAFYGFPLPCLGRNEHLGWGHTANRPDVADAYRLTFDDPANPLNYRTAAGYQTAVERTEVIRVQSSSGMEDKKFVFLDTQFGPVCKREDAQSAIAVRIARFDEAVGFGQMLKMLKATSFQQWQDALSHLDLVIFNCIYADREGNIAYIYNGAIPRRHPNLDWKKPVNAADPDATWKGYHSLAELPAVINPATGYVQNCNQSPFETTDDGNPSKLDFPAYLAEEADLDTTRAQVSRMLLRDMREVTLEQFTNFGMDQRLYWALVNLPMYQRQFQVLKSKNPELAARVQPYLDHLTDWDCVCGIQSTQATLCFYWYQELYGRTLLKPLRPMLPQYMSDPDARLEALAVAAVKLEKSHGNWKTPWGNVFRMVRKPELSALPDVISLVSHPGSLPCPGIPEELGGVLNTSYFNMPLSNKQIGIAGHSYVACIEFGKDFVRANSINTFGQTGGDPESKHFADQAQLFSQGQMKTSWFEWKDVLANAQRSYHPGK